MTIDEQIIMELLTREVRILRGRLDIAEGRLKRHEDVLYPIRNSLHNRVETTKLDELQAVVRGALTSLHTLLKLEQE